MSVKLREKLTQNGNRSLFLDIHSGGKRWKEYLNITLKAGTSPKIKAANKNLMETAVQIRNNRENDLLQAETGIVQKNKYSKLSFIDYFKSIIEKYKNKDARTMNSAFNKYNIFAQENNYENLKIGGISHKVCKEFADYLKREHKGETPLNYFTKFKYVLNRAIDDDIILKSPARGIKITKDNALKKNILSLNEIRIMAATHNGNDEIHRAFLFCCFTGLRWVDVKDKLTIQQFDFESGYIWITQNKTEKSSSMASLTIPITENIFTFLPKDKDLEPDEPIFKLPSHDYSNRYLTKWAKKAGVNKKLSWHCARHSCAVLLLTESKADAKTASSLIGLSSLKHFEKYTRAVDELRNQAASKLSL